MISQNGGTSAPKQRRHGATCAYPIRPASCAKRQRFVNSSPRQKAFKRRWQFLNMSANTAASNPAPTSALALQAETDGNGLSMSTGHGCTLRNMQMRSEFTAKTKLQAFERSGGRCESCTAKLFPGNGPEYDHRIACELGGDNSLDNCVCLCRACHKLKTSKHDMPRIAKAKRVQRRHACIKRERSIRAWRRFSGEPVLAPRWR